MWTPGGNRVPERVKFVSLSVFMSNTVAETLNIGFAYNMEHKKAHKIQRDFR